MKKTLALIFAILLLAFCAAGCAKNEPAATAAPTAAPAPTQAPAPAAKTFTVGFDFGERYNEISWAEGLSKEIGVEHHTHLIGSEEFWAAVPKVQYHMDQPLADPSCIALYFVSKYFILSLFYDGYDELNTSMNGRLSINEEAFMRYDVTLWGNDLDFDTSEITKDYFYIDSGYLHVLLGDGLIFTVIILLLYSILTYKLFRSRAYYLYIWILIYAILNISNGFLVALLENPILLLAFSDTEAISSDYYMTEENEEELEQCVYEEETS